MRFARYLIDGRSKLGVVEGDNVTEIIGRSEEAELLLLELGRADSLPRGRSLPLSAVDLLAPIVPGKIVAVGLNYRDHAAESGSTMPREPILFAKFPSAVVGPFDAIEWDRSITDEVDFEAELAVVICRRARNVEEKEALSFVGGYMCLNDVSARDLQFRDGQWTRGKSLDSFCPTGPWIVTADEVPNPQKLGISCTVSGEVLQEATTADMYFGVADLISWISRQFALNPGDVVATGTPPGVGYFRKPKRLLADGDTVTVAIEKLGELRNTCRAFGAPRVLT